MERKKENIIRSWFEIWLHKEDINFQELFKENAVYIESWRPEYHGVEKIKHWFYEWNTRGKVLKWDIKQFFHCGDQTIVFWIFVNYSQANRHKNAKNFVNRRSICLSNNPSPFH